MSPQRVQRKRTKGWRMPEGAVAVSRPSRWGNPFAITPSRDATQAVAEYRAWLFDGEQLTPQQMTDMARLELGGRDLACWCPLDQPCHADVLLELANAPTEERTCP